MGRAVSGLHSSFSRPAQAWTEARNLSGLHLRVPPAEGRHEDPWRGPHSHVTFSKMLLCPRKFFFFLFVRFHLCSETDNIIFFFFVLYFLFFEKILLSYLVLLNSSQSQSSGPCLVDFTLPFNPAISLEKEDPLSSPFPLVSLSPRFSEDSPRSPPLLPGPRLPLRGPWP